MKKVSRIKSARVGKGARVEKVPRVSGDKRCQGCQGLKGPKGAWVKSSEALLGGRVFSRNHFISSLTPEEGPSCYWYCWSTILLVFPTFLCFVLSEPNSFFKTFQYIPDDQPIWKFLFLGLAINFPIRQASVCVFLSIFHVDWSILI